MNVLDRFPTYRDPDTGIGFGIPVHPEPGIFETTTALVPSGVVDHTEVERVMARPKWSFEEANYRLHREAIDRRNAEFRAQQEATKAKPAKKAPAKKAAAKKTAADRTKKRPTPKRPQ